MPDLARPTSHPYHKDQFVYDEENDSYICPHEQRVVSAGLKDNKRKKARVYRIASASFWRDCPAFGVCTTNASYGRSVEIGVHEAALRRHRSWMATDEAQRPTGAGWRWSSRSLPSSRTNWEPSGSRCGA